MLLLVPAPYRGTGSYSGVYMRGALGHAVSGIFAEGIFADGTFADGIFAEWKFRRTEFSPNAFNRTFFFCSYVLLKQKKKWLR